jgi:anaerobic selenocysteine-containing dehydrogenase
MGKEVIYTFCGICEHGCGMKVHVKDNSVQGIEGLKEHPFSKGSLCVKGRSAKEIVYAKDRLKHPLKRSGNGWARIDWEEALDTIHDKLIHLKDEYGSNSLVVYFGQALIRSFYAGYNMKQFCKSYGTSNLSSAASVCNIPTTMSQMMTFGGITLPDFKNSEGIFIWGGNPLNSGAPTPGGGSHVGREINEALDNGAKLVVIDPRLTNLAKRSDEFIQIKPGTDGALALSILNIIIKEKLYDSEFVEKYTAGFDKLEGFISDYPPDKVENITWVPQDKIKKVAHLYAEIKPSCTFHGSGLEHHVNGFQSIRAIDLITALCGNIDKKGGNIFLPIVPLSSPISKEAPLVNPHTLGMKEHPLFVNLTQQAQALLVIDAMINEEPYPVKAMIVSGGNPVLTWPHSTKTIAALKKLDFLVVMDLFMNETAKMADLVLPAASFLERQEITVAPLVLQNKAIDGGECLSDWEFWHKLGQKMGYKDEFSWTSFDEAVEFLLKPTGISLKQLQQHPEGICDFGEPGSFIKRGFNTPSKKVELYAQQLEFFGYKALPSFKEGLKDTEQKVLEKFPYIATTGARSPYYVHSQFHSISALTKHEPEPFLEIHPETAHTLGIEERDEVLVESPHGSVKIKAKLCPEIFPKVVHLPHGWGMANCNLLSTNAQRDSLTGFPDFKSIPCTIRKYK